MYMLVISCSLSSDANIADPHSALAGTRSSNVAVMCQGHMKEKSCSSVAIQEWSLTPLRRVVLTCSQEVGISQTEGDTGTHFHSVMIQTYSFLNPG